MLKKFFIVLITITIIIGISGYVFATDIYTATSTINGVTVNWNYELNESNQIINLKCTNIAQLIGNIEIPSTLNGKTVVTIGNEGFKSATITGVTIPETIKEIGLWAFSGCTNLSNVNLGKVEKISDQSFKGCTTLRSITIPKTLNKDASGAPFSGCTNLTNIILEEGMTVIPNYLCANTKITEITIPNTVKEIGLWAFESCNMLNKITILDNVNNIEGYSSNPSDLVFKNHNNDLTIYCYENSMAAKYAIKYNIKYVYLTKLIDENSGEKTEKYNPEVEKEDVPNNTNNDTTVAKETLPQTGLNMTILVVIILAILVSFIIYKKYYNYKNIKK